MSPRFAIRMQRTVTLALAMLVCTALALGQDEEPTFRTQVVSSVVWDQDRPLSEASSLVQDPVTGNTIYKLSHAGIEVSSQMGFERAGPGEPGEFLNFTTTIVNNTQSELSVRHGGTSVGGRVATPLPVVSSKKGLSKQKREEVRELPSMHCFSSGFLSKDKFFSTASSSQVFTVAPRGALTVSLVTKDPRNYPMTCSTDGCHPTGTVRFAVTVNTTNFVFVWPGRSAVYCGN